MEGWQVIEQAAALAQRGEAVALATVVWRQGPSSGQVGSRAIITESGEVRGWIGGACAEPSVIRQAQAVLAEGAPRLLLLGTTDKFGDAIPEGGRPLAHGAHSRRASWSARLAGRPARLDHVQSGERERAVDGGCGHAGPR